MTSPKTEKNCGCPLKSDNTKIIFKKDDLMSDSCDSFKNDPCEYYTDGKETPISEIAKGNLPYKVIAASINENQVILRLQNEKLPVELDPPCDCLEPSVTNGNYLLRKVNPGGRKTINLYPEPETPPKGKHSKEKEIEEFQDEENLNVYLLKIKKRGRVGQNEENMNLEFRLPNK